MSTRLPSRLPQIVSRAARRLWTDEQRARIVSRMRWLEQARYRLFPGYDGNRRRLERFRDLHRGETCVIIGNGPSMRGFDLGRLAGMRCFCLNRGYLMWRDQGREPDYLVAVNDLVLHQFGAEIASAARERFVPWDARRRFSETTNTAFVETLWSPQFHEDITTGIWPGGTVTFTAMQIAFHMGFSRVVLIGVDHNFTHDGLPNQELLARAADPNHFDPTYFGPGVRWHAPDLATSERAYRMARRAFEAAGRDIVDATQGGQLTVFRRDENWPLPAGG